MLNIKKGVQVKIVAGKDKGKTGEILEIHRKLNKVKVKKEKNKPQVFSYSIKIADFYYEKSALEMIKRIKNETQIKKYKILSLSKTNFRVILGPFSDINSLKNSYNKASILDFENLEIIRHD